MTSTNPCRVSRGGPRKNDTTVVRLFMLIGSSAQLRFSTHYPEEMVKPKLRPRRDTMVTSPYQEARDELFQQIMQCGVIGCHADDQKEWFDATLQYLAGRYPELKAAEVVELRTLGERFAQPPKSQQVQEAVAV